jgi:hypothetical protein
MSEIQSTRRREKFGVVIRLAGTAGCAFRTGDVEAVHGRWCVVLIG